MLAQILPDHCSLRASEVGDLHRKWSSLYGANYPTAKQHSFTVSSFSESGVCSVVYFMASIEIASEATWTQGKLGDSTVLCPWHDDTTFCNDSFLRLVSLKNDKVKALCSGFEGGVPPLSYSLLCLNSAGGAVGRSLEPLEGGVSLKDVRTAGRREVQESSPVLFALCFLSLDAM